MEPPPDHRDLPRPKAVGERGAGALAASGTAFLLTAAGCAAVLGIEDASPPSTDGGAGDAQVNAADDAVAPAVVDGESGAPEPPSVEAGVDSAICAPAATRCNGRNVETCSVGGTWGAAADCPAGQACRGTACAPFPSCATPGAGRSSCGATGESCCATLLVEGGTFDRTYTNSGSGATGLANPATVSSFLLDKYDVTVGRFRQFVTAWNGGYLPADGSGKHTHLNGGNGLEVAGKPLQYEPGWVGAGNAKIAPTDTNLACHAYTTWTNPAGANEVLPINCVNTWEAFAFCIWDGGFLPSEAEFAYASAGGREQREYPWGATAPGTANAYAIYGCLFRGNGQCTGAVNIAPVGSATSGAGRYGQLDLAGNVWKLLYDVNAPFVDSCVDCYNPTGSQMVIRGGDFYNPIGYLPSSYRSGFAPDARSFNVGFRCARSP